MTLLVTGGPFAYEMECVTRLFYPREKITVLTEPPDDPPDLLLEARRTEQGTWQLRAEMGCEQLSDRLNEDAGEADAEWALARLLYRLLSSRTGVRPLWGILTGVRPVRLCRAMEDGGSTPGEVRRILRERYLVDDAKADLTLQIGEVERSLLARARPDGFSLYISIPFCPSRCLYCSFVSHDIKGVAKLVPEYVRRLEEEIRETGALARRQGLRLQTVYIGGGTPTTLEPEQLERIMRAVSDSFDLGDVLEYTVEAGRPDTITPEKLVVLRRMGADRVSVNPQTMDDAILQAIGRGHTAADVERGVRMARSAGFGNINMDLIAGLPGETGAEFGRTLQNVLALRPENITVHTLTVKRSSRLRESDGAGAGGSADLPGILAQAAACMQDNGYRPYYLYRQKGTVQNLENVGYALPGSEGLYNVLIMEEVQTILAVGAGAVSKICRPGEGLHRVFNYKFPYEYIHRFDEILRRKSEIETILGG